MEQIKRVILLLFMLMFTFNSVFGLEIVTQTEVEQQKEANSSQNTLKTIMIIVFGGGAMVLFIGFVLMIFGIGIMKFINKVTEFMRNKKDFLYYDFERNLNFCHQFRNYDLKKRNWKTLFITWKRSPVFLKTKEGLKQIGEYDGEISKKEGFDMVAIHNKLNMFKTIQTIVVVPSEWHTKIVDVLDTGRDKALVIEAEGIDEIGSTDYYFQANIPDPKKDNKFLDISDKFREEYTEKIVYRDIIKDELLGHKEAIIKAVESNPYVHQNRRKE